MAGAVISQSVCVASGGRIDLHTGTHRRGDGDFTQVSTLSSVRLETQNLVESSEVVLGQLLRSEGHLPNEEVKVGVTISTELDLAALNVCLLYTSPSPRDLSTSRMPSSA